MKKIQCMKAFGQAISKNLWPYSQPPKALDQDEEYSMPESLWPSQYRRAFDLTLNFQKSLIKIKKIQHLKAFDWASIRETLA